MIKCLNTLFCKECRVEDDGLMTLASIHSGFRRREMPVTASFCLVCFLELSLDEYQKKDVKELDLRILVFAPWGETIGDGHPQVAFRQISESIARGTVVSEYDNVTFTQFGRYSFEVFLNKERLYVATLDIDQETAITH